MSEGRVEREIVCYTGYQRERGGLVAHVNGNGIPQLTTPLKYLTRNDPPTTVVFRMDVKTAPQVVELARQIRESNRYLDAETY